MNKFELATLSGGCFWCTEAIFKKLKGVLSVISGYSGGDSKNPTYDEVCSGKTGHAEAIQIRFDPVIISFEKILEVFFKLHDPTTQNRQGADVGSQYRSAIFYHSDKQKQVSEEVKTEIEKSKIYPNPIITEITAFTNFFEAENYHQDFYQKNQNSSYCQIVIDPKIQKLYREFGEITQIVN